jgi:Tfp pilus assembly protein PilF
MPKARALPPKTGLPRLLWFILAAALAVKGAYLFFSRSSPFFEPLLLDPEYYHNWALRILKGDFAGDGVFYGLPLYPFFLALCYKLFGVSVIAVKIVQAMLGLVTVFFIYKIGEAVTSEKAGLLGAALAACYGPFFFHEAILIPESLGIPLYTASLYAALRFSREPSVKRGLGLGILFGLSALTKAGILPFAVLFAVFAAIRGTLSGERRFAAPAACLAAFLLTLAPVTAHNVIHGKDLVFLTSHGGFNFYVGNNPKAEGVFSSPQGVGTNVEAQRRDSRSVAEAALGRSLKPSEVSKYWSDQAREFIRGNPGRFVRLCLLKLALFFDAREISDVEDYVFGRKFNPMLGLPWVNFALLGPFFLAGLIVFFRKLKDGAWLSLWVACYIASVVLFFVNARYRLPVLGVFFPVAALGVLEAWGVVKSRAWGRVLLFAVVLAAAAGLTQAKLVGNNFARDHVNAGDALFKKNDIEGAAALYEKALEIDPDHAKANLAMGLALTKLGRYEESKRYYQRCIELDPGNAQAFNNLGMWYDRSGDLERARISFEKAVELEPGSALNHNNLGMIFGKLGENEKAVAEFERSVELNPGYARAWTNLGLVRYRLGEAGQARRDWQRALEADPGFEEARRALRLLEAQT